MGAYWHMTMFKQLYVLSIRKKNGDFYGQKSSWKICFENGPQWSENGKNIAIQLQMCNGCIIFDLLDYAGIFLFLEVEKITKSFEKILGKIIKPLYCTFFEILVLLCKYIMSIYDLFKPSWGWVKYKHFSTNSSWSDMIWKKSDIFWPFFKI